MGFLETKRDGKFVWVETAVSPSKRVVEFLTENVQNRDSREELLHCLQKLQLRTLPYGTEVPFKDVIPEANIDLEKVPTTKTSFRDYWRKTYGIELKETVQPLLVLEGSYGDFHYPAEMVYIARNKERPRLSANRHLIGVLL